MAALEDVGKVPGGDAIRNFLQVAHNDDGTLANIGYSVPFGSGDPQQLFAATTGESVDVKMGTNASPDTSLNPAVKVTRTHSIADAARTGSVPEETASILGISVTTATAGKMANGVMGVGITSSSAASTNNDAQGLMGFAETLSGATGDAYGVFAVARRNSGATGHLFGIEVGAQNYSGADNYAATAFSQSSCIDLVTSADTANTFQVGVGMQVCRNASGAAQFDVGIGFPSLNGGAVKTTTIRDDSSSVNSIVINGSHTGYGIDLNGGTFGRPIRIPTQTWFVARNAANSGDLNLLQSDSGDNARVGVMLIPGSGITMPDAQNIAVNTTTGTKIGTGPTQKLGFWNVTPVVQPSTTGTTTGFTAGTGTSVVSGSTFTGGTGTSAYTIGDIVLALKQSGLMKA